MKNADNYEALICKRPQEPRFFRLNADVSSLYPHRGVLDGYVKQKEEWSIKLIPGIMRKNGWAKGAELMEEWFRRKAYTYPDPDATDKENTPYNDSIVTLEWALGYKRVKNVYDKMWADKIYVNAAAKKEIEEVLQNSGKFNKAKYSKFGDLSSSAAKINLGDFYIQQRCTGSLFDTASQSLDGMVAALALANCCFHMAVEGTIHYEGVKETYFGLGEEDVYLITITKVGCYIKDSYDFIGNQLGGLGYWNPTINKAKKLTAEEGFYKVENKNFRDWRKKNGKEGDFLVFSNIEKRTVNESWKVSL